MPATSNPTTQAAIGRKEVVVYTVLLPYRVEFFVCDNVIDLRLPDTQRWFAEFFASVGDGVFVRPAPSPVEKFLRMLPDMMSQTLGGNEFTDAVGGWMLQRRISAFIYPSARSNAGIRIGGDIPEESYGWNLVDYRDADVRLQGTVVYGGQWASGFGYGDRVRVEYAQDGPFVGSWSVRGLEEVCRERWEAKKAEILDTYSS